MRPQRLIALGRRRQRGSSLVEGALCFTAFIFLTMGVMEFSVAMYAYNFVSYISSQAARYASLHGSQSSSPANGDAVQTYVRARAVGLTHTSVTVATTWDPDNHPGSNVKVVVSYTVVPIVHLMLRQNLTVRSAAQFVISN